MDAIFLRFFPRVWSAKTKYPQWEYGWWHHYTEQYRSSGISFLQLCLCHLNSRIHTPPLKIYPKNSTEGVSIPTDTHMRCAYNVHEVCMWYHVVCMWYPGKQVKSKLPLWKICRGSVSFKLIGIFQVKSLLPCGCFNVRTLQEECRVIFKWILIGILSNSV